METILRNLKQKVLEANLKLVNAGLVKLTWGNVSEVDRNHGIIAIKPSGIPYSVLAIEHIVIMDLEGKVVDGKSRPSVDAPTHIALYKAFHSIGGVAHTHSTHATVFAQARMEILCLGTTHADYFYGPVPVARVLTKKEMESDYERNTGKVIVETIGDADPFKTPAVLTASHGPFTWGKNAMDSVNNSIALETVAEMALKTLKLNPKIKPIPGYVLDQHYNRKHGPNARYGQK